MLDVRYQGHVAEVHFTGRRERNLLPWDLIKELEYVALGLHDNPDVRVVILTGQPSVFTGGFDLEIAVDALQTSISLNEIRMLNRHCREMCDA